MLTDYHLQPLGKDWCPPPAEIVGGRTLIPAFKDGDSYTIYCIEPGTSHMVAIDVEAPWPPRVVFASCLEFKRHILRIATEEKPEQIKKELADLLGVSEFQL